MKEESVLFKHPAASLSDQGDEGSSKMADFLSRDHDRPPKSMIHLKSALKTKPTETKHAKAVSFAVAMVSQAETVKDSNGCSVPGTNASSLHGSGSIKDMEAAKQAVVIISGVDESLVQLAIDAQRLGLGGVSFNNSPELCKVADDIANSPRRQAELRRMIQQAEERRHNDQASMKNPGQKIGATRGDEDHARAQDDSQKLPAGMSEACLPTSASCTSSSSSSSSPSSSSFSSAAAASLNGSRRSPSEVMTAAGSGKATSPKAATTTDGEEKAGIHGDSQTSATPAMTTDGKQRKGIHGDSQTSATPATTTDGKQTSGSHGSSQTCAAKTPSTTSKADPSLANVPAEMQESPEPGKAGSTTSVNSPQFDPLSSTNPDPKTSSNPAFVDSELKPEASTNRGEPCDSAAPTPRALLQQRVQKLAEENRKLKQRKLCRACRKVELGSSGITFLPCGHFITCEECAEMFDDCPACGKNIMGTVRTFLS